MSENEKQDSMITLHDVLFRLSVLLLLLFFLIGKIERIVVFDFLALTQIGYAMQ